jgi:two-component system, OmpR family, sensor kinase
VNAPIRVRLTGWYVLVLAAVVVGLGAFVVTRLRADLTSTLDGSLRSAASQIAQGYHAEGASDFRDVAHTVLPGPRYHGSGAQILDLWGPVAFSDGDPVVETPVLTDKELRLVSSLRELVRDARLGTPPEHLRVIGLSVTRHGRRQVLVVAESLAAVDRAVHRVLVLLLLGSGAALAVAALGGWWIARKALMPVERMTNHAEGIGIAEIRDHRIAVPGVRDELSHLALTLNAMLDRLQLGVEAREQLIADASHELRAPLAAMGAELDVSLRHDALPVGARAVLSSARAEVVRMGWIVQNLLTLARVDQGRLELLIAPQDLREVAGAAVRTHHLAARAAEVHVVVEGDAGLVNGDRDRLEQVMSNLLDNSIRVAPAGSTVRVSLWRSATEAGFTVFDDGPGIPPEERDRIFERFARPDRVRTRGGGAGLGLAICKEIVQAHGGRIWVQARTPRGSAFTVALALATPVTAAPAGFAAQPALSAVTAPGARWRQRRV